MELTSKLIAEYIEFINEKLDFIPVYQVEDFDSIANGLNRIILEEFVSSETPSELENYLISIQEVLQTPELYVQSPDHYQEFREIILSRIQSKISEFQCLTPEQKLEYIQTQQNRRERTNSNHQRMSARVAPQPGDEAHVISQDEMLAQMQDNPFAANINPQNPQVYHHVTLEFTAMTASELASPDITMMPPPDVDSEIIEEDEEEEDVDSNDILNINLRSATSRLLLAQAVYSGMITLIDYIDLMGMNGFSLSAMRYNTLANQVQFNSATASAQGIFRIEQHFRVPQNGEDIESIFLRAPQRR
jgi:hypothetical protein